MRGACFSGAGCGHAPVCIRTHVHAGVCAWMSQVNVGCFLLVSSTIVWCLPVRIPFWLSTPSQWARGSTRLLNEFGSECQVDQTAFLILYVHECHFPWEPLQVAAAGLGLSELSCQRCLFHPSLPKGDAKPSETYISILPGCTSAEACVWCWPTCASIVGSHVCP